MIQTVHRPWATRAGFDSVWFPVWVMIGLDRSNFTRSVFNELKWGDCLQYAHPGITVFVDDRTDFSGTDPP